MGNESDSLVGSIVDGRYVLTSLIAQGGMASVYLAHDNRLERTVAVKVIHSQLVQGPMRNQFIHRFHSEAQSAAAIANSHIVQVYDTGEFDGLEYLVMEYVHGADLRATLNANGAFNVRDAVRILEEILDGLAAAHSAGLIHRDVKPENILINARGHVEITDFGLAKAVNSTSTATTGLMLGTAAYLSPEVIEEDTATTESDLYSVGILGYEMLVGTLPFASSSPITMVFKHVHNDVPSLTSVDPHFPQVLSDFIARLTARNPLQRPHDAVEALEELKSIAPRITEQELFYRHQSSDSQTPSVEPMKPTVVRELSLDDVPAASSLPPLPSSSSHAQSTRSDEPVIPEFIVTQAFARPSTMQETQVLTSHQQPQRPQEPVQSSHARNTAKQASKPQKSTKPHKHRKLLIILLIVLAVVASFFAWWWFAGPGSYWTVPESVDKPCTQTVCSLTGADYKEYQETLKNLGIPYKATQVFDDDIEKGKIVSADPDVNGHVSRRGGVLQLKVSKGIEMVTIPADFLTCAPQSQQSPEETLLAAHFTNITVNEKYDLTPQGCAISIDPKPGATIPHNQTITLTVSKGPQPVDIPQDIIDMPKDDAIDALETLQLKVETTEVFDDAIAEGNVVSITPDIGTQVYWGDTVTLSISKGPETVTMPNVVGKSKDTAVSTLEALGFKVETQSSIYGTIFNNVIKQSQSANTQVPLRDADGNPTVIVLTLI